MKRATRMLLSLITVMTMLAPCVLAEIPHLINYQGRITDGSGNPMDGSYTITFRIYDDPTGGTIKWTETHNDVAVNDGLFEVVLGSVVAIGSNVLSSQPRWLGLTLDGGTELSPRTQILAVAYAYRAEHADTADYAHATGSGDSGWVDDGNVVRLAWGTDSVGIGTGDPQEKLHVNGDIRVGLGSDISFGNDNTRLYGASGDLSMTADDDIYLRPDDDIYVRRDGGSDWVHFDNSTERLGIGITNPPYKLTVNGEVSIAAGGESKYHINYYQGGLNFAETGVSDRRIHIGDGGDVGIGTASPGAKLGVNGDAKIASDLQVNGAFKGDIESSSGTDGAPFPRPAYDSGWLAIAPNETLSLTHNIGGNRDNYVVDMQFWSSIIDVHVDNYGGRFLYSSSHGSEFLGAYYRHLTNTGIEVYRLMDDVDVEKVRVRIWVVE